MKFLCLGKRDFLFLATCFVLCALIINYGVSGAQAVLSMSQKRKLPIYCVDTDEKKSPLPLMQRGATATPIFF